MFGIEEMKIGSRIKIHAQGVVSATVSDPTKMTAVLAGGFLSLQALAAGPCWLIQVSSDLSSFVHMTTIVP